MKYCIRHIFLFNVFELKISYYFIDIYNLYQYIYIYIYIYIEATSIYFDKNLTDLFISNLI